MASRKRGRPRLYDREARVPAQDPIGHSNLTSRQFQNFTPPSWLSSSLQDDSPGIRSPRLPTISNTTISPPLDSHIASGIPYASALGTTYGQSTSSPVYDSTRHPSNHVPNWPTGQAEMPHGAIQSNFIDTLSNQIDPDSSSAEPVGPVLPSPAPSDDVHETSAVQSTTNAVPSDASRLHALLAQYGGVEGLEKTLARSTTNSTTPVGIPQGTNNRAAAASPTTLQRGQPNQPNEQAPARPSDNLIPSLASRGTNPSQTLPATDVPQAASPTIARTEFDYRSAKDVLQNYATQVRGQGGVVEGRLALLIEACNDGDLFYLVLHRLYCLDDQSRRAQQQPNPALLNQEVALKLATLILANSAIPPMQLRFFADFPNTIPNPNHLVNRIKGCMATMTENWDRYISHWRSTRTMPLVETMRRHLGVASAVLQRVIYTYVLRVTWQDSWDRCPCMQSLNHLFRESQHQDDAWLKMRITDSALPSEAERVKYYDRLQTRFNLILHEHQQHSTPTVNPSVAGNQVQGITRRTSYGVPIPPDGQGPSPGAQRAHVVGNSATSPAGNPEDPRRPSIVTEQRFNNQLNPSHRHTGSLPSMYPQRPPSGPSPLASVYPPPPPPPPPTPPPPQSSNSRHSVQAPWAPTPLVPSNAQSAHGARHQARHIPPQVTGPHSSHRSVVALRHPSVNQSPQQAQYMQLFPMPYIQRPLLPNPPPEAYAMQQAYLRDATIKPLDLDESDGALSTTDWFSYLSSLALEPYAIRGEAMHVDGTFHIPEKLYRLIPRDESDKFGAPPTRRIAVGSIGLRIRCIQSRSNNVPEQIWATSDTKWPKNIALRLNNKGLDVRRKYLHSRDLPIDVTSIVISGVNQLSISSIQAGKELEDSQSYLIAVEVIEYSNRQTLKTKVLDKAPVDTGERIRNRLSNKDNDIEILTRDLVVNLLDPFTSQQVVTPVRSVDCTHYECFDLDVYLDTRLGNPCIPEKFKCPICNSDGRPQNLVADEWISAVIKDLGQNGRTDVGAVIVNERAEWRIKEEEVEGESGDGTGQRLEPSNGTSRDNHTPQQDVVVITLD